MADALGEVRERERAERAESEVQGWHVRAAIAEAQRDVLIEALRAVMANSEMDTDAFILARAALEAM